MPKKHNQRLYTKPPSTAPSTFASASPASSSSRTTTTSALSSNTKQSSTSEDSVNGLLNRLRISQVPRPSDLNSTNRPPAFVTAHRTLHPSLNELLGVELPPAPRPRSRIIGSRSLSRTTAGPPPPNSWVVRPPQTSTTTRRREALEKEHRDVWHLPGLTRVDSRSLLHATLVQLAKNWEWHVVYDQYYLYELRETLKSTLLAYVGVYSPHGVGKEGIRVLFTPPADLFPNADESSLSTTTTTKDPEPADSWDAPQPEPTTDSLRADITHLDLSRALHPSPSLNTKTPTTDLPPLTPKSLKRLLLTHPPPPLDLPASTTSPPSPRFPNLKHLSLAHPHNLPPSTWNIHLLPLLAYLPTLTHLSLAFWPTPENPTLVFRMLARQTYCLKFLDLSGQKAETVSVLMEMAEVWVGGWRAVETVVWKGGEGGMMPGLMVGGDEEELRGRVVEWRRRVGRSWEMGVRRRRREGEGGGGVVAPGRFRVVVEDEM